MLCAFGNRNIGIIPEVIAENVAGFVPEGGDLTMVRKEAVDIDVVKTIAIKARLCTDGQGHGDQTDTEIAVIQAHRYHRLSTHRVCERL